MKISEISIKNFRSFDERGVSISVGEMAAFVGKNSSGKSNILQALQLFWGQYALTAEDFYYGETSRTISVSVTFAIPSDEITPSLLPYVSPDGFLQLCHDYTETDTKGKLYSCGKNDFTGTSDMNPFPERKLTTARITPMPIEMNNIIKKHFPLKKHHSTRFSSASFSRLINLYRIGMS